MHSKKTTDSNGFATLMAVLIVGVFGVAVVIGFLNRGIDANKNALSITAAYQARQLADDCAEIALQGIRNTTDYEGKGSSTSDKGGCTYEVTSMGGTRKDIVSIGTSNGAIKKILVEIQGVNPKIIIISWREVL
ncbi:MAG: hypothetical protein RL641_688 [Candidatus Parcubacteria bacterium]|jgi:hypothetical protein